MRHYQPKAKISFQTQADIYKIKFKKLKKKKWFFFKINLQKKKKFKFNYRPEKLEKNYKKQLIAKQQLRAFYGCLKNYKLKNKFNFIKKYKKNFILEKLIINLESQLDTVLYRSGIVKSIFHARQLINHKKIYINNQLVSNHTFNLKKGDIIYFKIQKEFLNKKYFKRKFFFYESPDYLMLNLISKKLLFLRKPTLSEIKYPFFLDIFSIQEFLQKN